MLKLTPLRLSGVPPPMAHCEVAMDANIVDVAFSRTGERIAVLTRDNFSVFAWSIKQRPVPEPMLESSYPLPTATENRPRQIAFLNENEVYVLTHRESGKSQIERTALETRESKVVYEAAEGEHVQRIFSSLCHRNLWFSKLSASGIVTYSRVIQSDAGDYGVEDWANSPPADTHWAYAVRIGEDQVRYKSIGSPPLLTVSGRLGRAF